MAVHGNPLCCPEHARAPVLLTTQQPAVGWVADYKVVLLRDLLSLPSTRDAVSPHADSGKRGI